MQIIKSIRSIIVVLLLGGAGPLYAKKIEIAPVQGLQSELETSIDADFFEKKVNKIFENRCMACHSCFNAPCQLNLQSFSGFERGAHRLNVYNGTRPNSVDPTRMGVDAETIDQWRKLGFFSVNTSAKLENNLFWATIRQRQLQPQAKVQKQVAESLFCAQNIESYRALAEKNPELGMPYGFPALTDSESQVLEKWLGAGAPGPRSTLTPTKKTQRQIQSWESYLNQKTNKQKLISRYLYEHLFLAHLYFPEEKRQFFRMVRSKTSCQQGISEIATRRPNDSPNSSDFFYCLKPFAMNVVKKTHLPYELGPQKLRRIRQIFNQQEWTVTQLPGYEAGLAENPFRAFADIPVQARYQFLLDDARYHVATFIKGPVCNGSMAVNSIQEQFYVFFLQPQSDNMVISKTYAKKVEPLLMLPGVWGSDIEILETPTLYKRLVDHREAYRKVRSQEQSKVRSEGYTLSDIWDGDKKNPNAVLTVFRHDDNAVVQMGAVGDLSKTVFVLDYPLFERLVYNLVVNFDVFGNVSHQLLTRIYMDMIRMEAEELFLMFLPPEQRLVYRKAWYQGLLTQAKMTYVFPLVGSGEPTGIRFSKETETKRQLVEKILFYRLSEKNRGSLDLLNWRHLNVPASVKIAKNLSGLEQQLTLLDTVKAQDATAFARFFTEF